VKDLRERRQKLGLTQAELGRRCGITGSYISHVELGDYSFKESLEEIVNRVLNGKAVDLSSVVKRKYTQKGAIPDISFKDVEEEKFFRGLWIERYGGE